MGSMGAGFSEEMRKRKAESKGDKKGKEDKGGKAPADPFGEAEVKPTADAADAVLADAGLADAESAAAAPVEGAEGAEGAEGGASPDVAPLVEKLGVDEDTARSILEAAKKFAETKALDAAALADALNNDIKLRFRVEEEAARLQDEKAGIAGSGAPDTGGMGDMGGAPMVGGGMMGAE